ncbi:MAG: hypothetical protein PWQ56_139, partial [Patescibacteria group bacterium]|nr:hypothetical protein [Patescibacteria group bacterium]
GFFGTSSRAKANALLGSLPTTPGTTLPAGCTSTEGYSSTTGQPCSATSSLPEGCTSTSGFSPITGQPCSTGSVATGDYTVSLASNQPSGTLASGSAYNTMLKVNVSAGASAQTITSVTVERTGLSLDSNVDGVLVADEQGVRYGNIVTFANNSATISFPSQPITVDAGTTKTILIQYNLVSGALSGTIGAKVTAMSGSPAGLPLVGSTFNLVDGKDTLGVITVAEKTVTSAAVTKDIGTVGYDIAKFTLTESKSNEDIYLSKLTVYQNGTAADGDVTNIKLVAYDGTVLSTVASTTNREATFDLSANPYKIGKGVSRDFTIRIDITSGSSRTVQFTIQNNYDVVVKGADTGMGILSSSTFPVGNTPNKNTVSINAGSLSVSRDSTSPSGTISIGSQDVVLATYKFEARGEDIEVRSLKAEIVGSGLTANDFSGTVRLVTEDGQTIASVATGTLNLITTGSGTGATITLSPYYTIPAGQSKKISVVVDTSSNMGPTDQPVASIKDVYYKKALTNSYATTATNWISGNTMTASRGTLTVGKNAALGNSNKVKGQNEVKIGSYLLQTNSTEGVNVSSIAIKLKSKTSTDITGISNLKIKNGETLLGQSVSSPAVGKGNVYNAAANSINVAGQLNIPASTTVQLDVYADIGSSTNAEDITSEIDTNGVTGTGSTSSVSVTGPDSPRAGQTMTLVDGGTLEVSIDTSSAPASQFVVGGLSGIEMAKIKLYGTIEDMKIERLELKSVNASGNISQVKLLGTGLSTDPTASLLGGVATFTFPGGSEILVPAYSTKIITVAVDTTNAGTIVAGDLGVIGFGTMNVKGAGSGNIVQETVTGNTISDLTVTGDLTGTVIYFTKDAVSGTYTTPGYYMVTSAVTDWVGTGVQLNGGDTATRFASDDKVVKLTGITDSLVGGNAGQDYARGDVVFIHDNDTTANDGFYTVTTAVASGSSVSGMISGLTLVAADQVTKLTNANALFSNTMQFEEVKPVISKNASSPAGTTSGSSEQTVAMFDVKAEGQRDLIFSALTLEKGGNNDPSKNVTKFYLYNGGTKLAQVDSTTVTGAIGATVTSPTITFRADGAGTSANIIGGVSKAEYNTIKAGDTLTFCDTQTTPGCDTVTVSSVGTWTSDAVGGNVVLSAALGTLTVGNVTIYNNRVHFDANSTGQALAAQTITAGQTMTLTVKADTQNVKTGADSGQTVNFTMTVPGSTGPLTTTAGGLTWTYTKLGSGTEYSGTLTDSYPVNANTLSY